MVPTDNAAIATRPSSRMWRNCAKPRPRSPSRFDSGTRQSSNVRPCVSEACQPILRYGGWTSNPAEPDGTMIAEISPGPVRAVTVTSAVIAVPELVMNAFSPLITHVPSTSSALVRVAPASDPASGSVRPNAPSASPAHRRGSHSCFCASDPK